MKSEQSLTNCFKALRVVPLRNACKVLSVCLLLMIIGPTVLSAQETKPRLISSGRLFFVPHDYVKFQVGGAYDVGEGSFGQLLSPALSFTYGYMFTEQLGLQANLSGLWAKNRYAYPEAEYAWKLVQGTVDAKVNLSSLLFGSKPDRTFQTYGLLGFGVAYSFDNDEAKQADDRFGIDFQKRWEGHRINPVLRAGLGADYALSDQWALCAELNANVLPDHFNSKKGKGDNRDWRFNALIGVKYTFGKSHGRTEPIYEKVTPPPTPVVKAQPVVERPKPAKVDTVRTVEKISFNVNIYFQINQSKITPREEKKLVRLVNYLEKHPKAYVRLSGFADKDTGTSKINLKLAQDRVREVSAYLQDAGIDDTRIRRFAKGDTVQPFDMPEDNRVCICFVYDPENPVPVENW